MWLALIYKMLRDQRQMKELARFVEFCGNLRKVQLMISPNAKILTTI